MKKILQVKGLRASLPTPWYLYPRKRKPLFEEVSLTLREGARVGIWGDGDSGARAVGYTLLHLLIPTGGEIELLEKPLTDLSLLRQTLQLVLSDPKQALAPHQTIFENLGAPLRTLRRLSVDEVECKVKELLIHIDISPSTLHCYPSQFSEEQQQRLAIGRALSLSPRLLIGDELLSGASLSLQESIFSLLRTLSHTQKLGYLLLSAHLPLLSRECDYLLIMYKGKIVEEGPASRVLNNPKHPYTQWVVASLPLYQTRRPPLKPLPPQREEATHGCPFYARCPYAETGCAHYPAPRQQEGAHSYFCVHLSPRRRNSPYTLSPSSLSA